MKIMVLSLRQWLSIIPIKDPVERRMASLVQALLFGFMGILLIAAVINLLILPAPAWQGNFIRTAIFILVIGLPLVLLRRGHFRSSVVIINTLFLILETFAVAASPLREIAETLLFFTLAMILAGLILGRQALIITLVFSTSVVLMGAIREQNTQVRMDNIVIASNFILLNGLIGLFLDRFGLTLRSTLLSSLQRERELQKEITERKRVEDTLERRVAELMTLYQSGIALSQTVDQKEIAEKVIEVMRVNLSWHHAAVRVKNGDSDELELAAFGQSNHLHIAQEGNKSMLPTTKQGIVGWVMEHGKALRIQNVSEDPRYVETYPGMVSGLYVPLKIYNRTLGCISVESDQPEAFNKEDEYLLITLAVQAAVAMENARLLQSAQEEIAERKRVEHELRQRELDYRRQVERLTALSQIDQAIVSSFDIKVTLEVFVSQVISQLKVDAVDVLLLGSQGDVLEYAAGQGFRSDVIKTARALAGESFAGQVARVRHLILVGELTDHTRDPLLIGLTTEEKFVSYCGVPLIAKGKVIGVLEMFSRTSLNPSSEWLDFLNALAGQAAIAIESSNLFDSLELSNHELIQAYDATIEGWSRAMDLRDKETEGHTQRVTRMTLELSHAMNMKEEQLIHIRRGALLHDIGKLGIPDHILLKEDKLTDGEWEVMRKHPQFAYNMLSSIKYLQPALKIPYCHHERWDGTGYPRGLKGQQIPLEARIFAVVDVWDALRSDRSYRPAWDVEAARRYIREHAGSHFDPTVVEYFLKIIN